MSPIVPRVQIEILSPFVVYINSSYPHHFDSIFALRSYFSSAFSFLTPFERHDRRMLPCGGPLLVRIVYGGAPCC